MKAIAIYLFALLSVLLNTCDGDKKQSETPENSPVDMHTSQNALDWSGFYVGTLPCADCEGIYTTITLDADGSFLKKTVYLDKESRPYETTGTFTWNDAGNTITLKQDDKAFAYFVGENTLTALNMDGQKNTGALADRYILHKKTIGLTGTKWKLVKLYGKDVTNDKARISFHEAEGRISGNGGCNGFGGEYTTEAGNRISFSKLMGTMMACEDMTTETDLFKVLQTADNYSLRNDTLSLNKARMAPLAVFAADFRE